MRELVMIWMSMLAGLTLLAFGANRDTDVKPQSVLSLEVATTSSQDEIQLPEKKAAPRFPVVKVVDGDTVVIERNGKNETLRLIGMDAPETTTLRKGVVECFGKEASRRAE